MEINAESKLAFFELFRIAFPYYIEIINLDDIEAITHAIMDHNGFITPDSEFQGLALAMIFDFKAYRVLYSSPLLSHRDIALINDKMSIFFDDPCKFYIESNDTFSMTINYRLTYIFKIFRVIEENDVAIIGHLMKK